MKLNLYHNEKFTCAMLINYDAEQQNGQHIDNWDLGNAISPNMTYARNPNVTSLNPYKCLRVRFLFTVDGIRKTKDFFCVNDIIKVNNLSVDYKF